MTKSYILALSALMALTVTLPAAADKGVTVHMANGEDVQLPFARIERIDFGGGAMHLKDTDGTVTDIPYASVTDIRFDLEIDPNSVTDATFESMTLGINRGLISISAPDGTDVDLSIFSLSGQTVSSQRLKAPCTLDLNGLDKGVYIIKANDKTLKYINR